MRIKFENKQNINVLLETLKEISNINKDGQLTYHSLEFQDIEWVFLSIIDFGNTINVESQKNILSRTLKEVALNQRYEKEFFINQLTEQIQIYNNKEVKTYYLLSSLSITKLPFRKIIFKDCTILIHGTNFPAKFKQARSTLLKQNRFDEDISSYTKVSVQITSRNYKDAYTKGFYYLEIFRGFLCLLLNHGYEMRFGERSRKPINRILRGETTTLHLTNGQAADKNFFYFTQDYKKAETLTLKEDQAERIKSSIKFLIRSFNNCKPKHQSIIGQTLNCYVDAFDEYSFDISFLKAWTALEKITNTDQNEELIRRSIALYEKKYKPYEKQKLEALRIFRNEFIHEGDKGLNSFHACYMIQEYIYNLIMKFNLQHSGFFENIDEANIFLDNFIPDIKDLHKRKKILDKVLYIKQKNTKR